MNKRVTIIAALLVMITLAACSSDSQENTEDSSSNHDSDQTSQEMNEEHEHGEMEHMDGEIPKDMKEAENPKYEAGSKAIIQDGHMAGMKGAVATIVGAYETTVYAVSYDPVSGGERVENHKWVVHEELKESDQEPFQPGSKVTLEANHMEGMAGAHAVVETAEQTTVYVIDYVPQDGGDKVTNHLWVTEEELAPAE
ncbi:YdhK family protein [Virgibacillus senegalensis]|uniref:YdhK family protein n=1 Tax=Virgibacillus senegalensis TaxID=1499679 RepID=UPI00069F2FEB|nr:YdhK family protein [Virgibacillus senegalensis]